MKDVQKTPMELTIEKMTEAWTALIDAGNHLDEAYDGEMTYEERKAISIVEDKLRGMSHELEMAMAFLERKVKEQ